MWSTDKARRWTWTVGIGVPLIFLVVSLVTANWKFFLFSLAPAMIATSSGLAAVKAAEKKEGVGK